MLKVELKTVTSFAPATCANVAVGFDILGFAIESVGDSVTLTKRDDNQIVINQIDGLDDLPKDISKNTASVVLKKLCDDFSIDTGFSIHIRKGIAIGSGMGGSAASAVATLVALNAFLKKPLPQNELAQYALHGEKIACGQMHADNIVPCIYGGMTLIYSSCPIDVVQLPTLELFCVIIHPHLRVDTKYARQALSKELPLNSYVKQSAYLATFIASIYQNDINLFKKSAKDMIIEPQRAKFVPGFYDVKKAAIQAGALAVSFSGSGPSMFAFAVNKLEANHIANTMRNTFIANGINSDHWITPMNSKGAFVTHFQ
jgi:homoserine kinase